MKNTKKVLVLGAFPPPLFGSALMLQYISEIKDDNFSFHKFQTNFNKNFENIETFSFSKVLLFIFLVIKFLFCIYKYDIIIISQSFRFAAFLKDYTFMFISKLFKKKLIIYAQGLHFDKFYENRNKVMKKIIDIIFFRVDYFVTVGKNQQLEYSKWAKNNITYIYNFVEISENENNRKVNDSFNILFLSTLTSSKGIFTFLKAIDVLEKKANNYKYILCGSFRNKNFNEKTEIYAYSKKYEDKIILRGRVEGDEKFKVLMNADLFVSPTNLDSFCIVNLEAMHFGLPIITTRQGAIKEYFIEPKNGFFIQENDYEELANKIEILSSDRKLLEEIGSYNKIYVKRNFNRDIFSNQWLSVLNKVVS